MLIKILSHFSAYLINRNAFIRIPSAEEEEAKETFSNIGCVPLEK